MSMLVLLAALRLGCPQEETAQEVTRLIEKLSSDRIEDRESAARTLKEIGPAAIDALERAAAGEDAERRARSKRILTIIRTRGRLSAGVIRGIPGIDERLALGAVEDWTAAFLEASSEVESQARYPTLCRADLECLLEGACQGARGPRDKKELCLAIARWHFAKKTGFVATLIHDSDPRVRGAAIKTLGELRDQTRAATLVGLLKDPDEAVQTEAYWALVFLRSRDVAEPLRALLKDEDAEVRRKAASLLGYVPDQESVPHLVRLLSDEAPMVRANAALSLAELGVKDQAPAIASLLRDPAAKVRGLAVVALMTLNARESLADICGGLTDEDGSVRFYTVRCLERWVVPEKADSVALLAKDPWTIVRAEVPRALACFRADRYREVIASALADPDEQVRGNAIDALGKTEGAKAAPLLRPLLKDPERQVRIGAAAQLLTIGVRDGVTLLLEEDGDLHGLNAVRQAAEWAAVIRPLKDSELSGTRLEILERIAVTSGLRLDLSRIAPADLDTWLSDPLRMRLDDQGWTASAALQWLLWFRADWILDEGVIRILPAKEVRAFWGEWWKKNEKK